MPIFTGTARTQFASFNESETESGKIFAGLVDPVLNGLKQITGIVTNFQNSYVEDGTYDIPGVQTQERTYPGIKVSSKRKQYAQRPKATVFIKKKQFGSLSNNYDIKLLDDDEKMYIRCVKALLKRKCDEIAFYESLVNISSIYETSGFLTIDDIFDSTLESALTLFGAFAGSESMEPALADLFLSPSVANTPPPLGVFSLSGIFEFLQGLYNAKKHNDRSKASSYTRWVEDPFEGDYSGLGPGTGVIEFNMASSINIDSSLAGQGSANMSVEDPYQLMLINDTDIEIALRTATSAISSLGGVLRGSSEFRLALAQRADRKLSESRRKRRQKDISFEFEDEMPVAILGIVNENDPAYYKWPRKISSKQDVDDALRLGITREEIALANEVLMLLGEYQAATKLSYNVTSNISPSVSGVRDRLRRDFLGQHLVQPMDQVTVFINSNTQDITPVSGIMDLLDASAGAAKEGIDISLMEQERLEICPGIPLVLYMAIRKQNVFRDDGICTFSGLVDSVSDDYSGQSGAFSVSVRCSDNTKYLELSRFTLNPSLNNTYGAVNDPLTPFDLDAAVDAGTGLIIADRLNLSQQNNDRINYLRFPSGPNVGKSLRGHGSLIQDKRDNIAIVTHTPGLVYKWKQGIVATTLNQAGGGGAAGGLSPFSQPFAKLDAANIASILITGQPYDYGTFLEGVSKVGGTSVDSTNLSRDFFNYIYDYVGKVNKYYGNFVPAKNQALDRDSVVSYFQLQNSLKGLNTEANKKIAELLTLEKNGDTLKSQSTDESGPLEAEKTRIRGRISELSSQMTQLQGALPEGIQISIEGNNTFVSVDAANVKERDSDIAYRLKKKPEEVRFNQDKNFFVVSSSYDTEFTIQSFAANLKGRFSVYDAEYKTPKEIIKAAAEALQLEFFADNNGNLILRPPRYNRTPLSLMLEVLKNEPKSGKGILPSFVKNLLGSRVTALRNSLLQNELNIAYELYSLAIESTSVEGQDGTVIPLLKQVEGAQVYEIDDAKVDLELNKIKVNGTTASHGSFVFGPNSRLQTLMAIDKASSTKTTDPKFTTEDKLVTVILTKKKINGENFRDTAVENKAREDARSRIGRLSGADAKFTAKSGIDKISSYLNARRAILRSMSDVMRRNTTVSIDSPDSYLNFFDTGLSSSILSLKQLFMGSMGLPPGLDQLVENDLANTDGPGSSKRFIIDDGTIIQSGFSHNPPEFTQAIVTGTVDFISSDGEIAGIPVLTAVATDFDSWRQYGFRQPQTINRPDMTSAEQQCAPYARLLLSNQRRKMHAGSVTLMGNEHYQLGDNVYISYRGMIYYVTRVSHSVNLGSGSYTTTLDLEYGRAVGDIIPTPLDLAGAVPTGASAIAKNYRSETSVNNADRRVAAGPTIVNLGTVHLNPVLKQKAIRDGHSSASIDSTFLASNSRALQNIALRARARTIIAPDTDSYIEVRGYYVTPPAEAPTNGNEANLKILAEHFASLISSNLGSRLDGGNPNSTAPTNNSDTISAVPVTSPAPSSSANAPEIRPPLIINISNPIPDDIREKLPFPSEDAWISASPTSVVSDTSGRNSSAAATASAVGLGIPGITVGLIIDSVGSQGTGAAPSMPSGSKVIDLPVNAFDVVLVMQKKNK